VDSFKFHLAYFSGKNPATLTGMISPFYNRIKMELMGSKKNGEKGGSQISKATKIFTANRGCCRLSATTDAKVASGMQEKIS
jgi:hypothetical protein